VPPCNKVWEPLAYTVPTDSPVIIFLTLIYSLSLCWGNVSNSNVTMKFAQLRHFL